MRLKDIIGAERYQSVSNDTPTPETFLTSVNRIVWTSIAYPSLNGNVPVKDFNNNEN